MHVQQSLQLDWGLVLLPRSLALQAVLLEGSKGRSVERSRGIDLPVHGTAESSALFNFPQPVRMRGNAALFFAVAVFRVGNLLTNTPTLPF